MTETQQRFLKAIADRVGTERIAEVRVFPVIRQGHVESAVAVIAVEERTYDGGEHAVPLEVTPADVRAVADMPEVDLVPDSVFADRRPPAADLQSDRRSPAADESPGLGPRTSDLKYSFLTARYCLTLKGPDRGKWEFDLVHDADAPLDTMERVVRGAIHRAGEDGEAELLSPGEFHKAVTEPWWAGGN